MQPWLDHPTTDGPVLAPLLSREAMEAHLTLTGWRPLAWAAAGAYRAGVVVYCYHTKPCGELMVAVDWRKATFDDALTRREIGVWYMSGDLFWPIAHKMLEIDACQHETIGVGGAPMRCNNCGQMVDR